MSLHQELTERFASLGVSITDLTLNKFILPGRLLVVVRTHPDPHLPPRVDYVPVNQGLTREGD